MIFSAVIESGDIERNARALSIVQQIMLIAFVISVLWMMIDGFILMIAMMRRSRSRLTQEDDQKLKNKVSRYIIWIYVLGYVVARGLR